MSWPTVKLEDVFEIVRGGSPRPIDQYITEESDGLNWISIKDASNSGKYITKTKLKIKKEGLSKSRLVKPGDFLLTNSMSFGRPYIMKTSGCIHDGWLALTGDPEKVDADFFYYLLGSNLLKSKFAALAKGAVVKNLNINLVKGVQILLPPLETQKQIAAVLEKADQLRKDCQQMEQELNSLAQSVFIDMFGDPVTNPKGWDMKALSDLAIIVTGNTPSRAKPEYYGSYIEWIKSGNINTPSDYLTIAEEYLSESGKKVGRVVQSGSVLMTCIAGSPDCIGNVAIADREVAFNQQINALVPIEKKLNTDFLYILLKVAKKIIQSASTNSMKGMISKSKLESIQLPFPSYDEQCDFSAIYRKLQKVLKEQQEQVIETELMFNSLMQKAFKGELNL
ncbi:restriction endonuclease subunit S [Vibrio metschnikovii]|nr:restriction endonuclease subunit S [Vibrio metschnikovii]EKO3887883.1 restriction endonuclease subunit S [Vibrio metschnikovii]EKO3936213.1 restriction endonuclease subunit S [Vibrio metschnikovii]